MRVTLTHIFVLVCYIAAIKGERLLGGYSPERPLSETEQEEFTPLVMTELPALTGTDVNGFRFISVRTQVVNGINYLFLIELPDGTCSSVKIYQPVGDKSTDLELLSAQPVECPLE